MKMTSLLKIAIATAGLSLVAAANPVTITFLSGGSSIPGGTSYYPYQIQVNNGTGNADYQVACDDYFDEVTNGQTYTGWVSTYSDLSKTLFNGGNTAPSKQYQELAWLYTQLQPVPPSSYTNPQNAAINYAMWDLFDGSAPGLDADSSACTLNPTAANCDVAQGGADTTTVDDSGYWLQAANTWYNNGATGVDFSGFLVFTPGTLNGSGNFIPDTAGNGGPQEFITSTVPEPASLALLGTGLLLLAFVFKRRLHDESAQSANSLDLQA